MNYGDRVGNNPKEIASLFAEFFSSVYVQRDAASHDGIHPSINSYINLTNIYVDNDIVFNNLISLDIKKVLDLISYLQCFCITVALHCLCPLEPVFFHSCGSQLISRLSSKVATETKYLTTVLFQD